MKVKVFFILSFSPPYNYLKNDAIKGPVKIWYNNNGEFIGVWDYDWAHIIGNRILKIDDEIEYTVLRTDFRADKVYEYEFKTGLKHISFPSRKKKEIFGIKFSKSDYSKELIKYLEKVYNKKENFLLIIPISRRILVKKLIKKFHKKVPIINPHFVNNSVLLPELSSLRKPFRFIHRFFLKTQTDNILKKLKYVTLGHKSFQKQIEEKYKLKTIIYTAGFDQSEWIINMSKEKARKKISINPDTKVILISSRFTPEKQIDRVLEVLGKFKNEKFICFISGRGDLKYTEYLESLIMEYGLADKVKFTGFLSEEDLVVHYIASDVFVMSSINEAGPGSTNIAVWYDVPIISTDTGFTAELLKENNAGIVVPTTKYSEWEKAFKRFFDGEKIRLLDKEVLLQNKGAEVNIKRLIGFIKEVYNNFYKTNI